MIFIIRIKFLRFMIVLRKINHMILFKFLPIIVENNIKNYKKNRNNIFSYWPYFAPESCINFKEILC